MYTQNLSVEKCYNYINTKSNFNDTALLIKSNEYLAKKTKVKHIYYFKLGVLFSNKNPSLSKSYFLKSIQLNPDFYLKIKKNFPQDSMRYISAYAHSLSAHSRKPQKDSALKIKCNETIKSDQFYRNQISLISHLSTENYQLFKHKFDSLMSLQKKNDQLNQHVLDSIIVIHGWPDLRYVDEEPLNYVFTIAQHCTDVKKRQYYLKLMQSSVKHGNDTYIHLAYYIDRTCMFKNKPQYFGTENIIKDKSGMAMYKVKNEKKLNDRRIRYGLNPLVIHE